MSGLQKVAAGQGLKVSASDWNAFIDAARDFQNRAAGRHVPRSTRDTQPGIVWVRNDTGAAINQMYAILGLDGLAFDASEMVLDELGKVIPTLIMKGVRPDKTKHRGRFCVLTGPVDAGKLVRAYLDAVTPARLFVPDGETYNEKAAYAEIDDFGGSGKLRLRSACYGSAQILYREKTGTGEMWAVVRLGRTPATFPVKLEQVGGSQGTSTAAASWTYDVKDFCTDEKLNTSAVTPTTEPHGWQRPTVGQMIKATHGLARFDKDGKPILTWINEIAAQESCDA